MESKQLGHRLPCFDGGYLSKLLKKHFGEPTVDYAKFSKQAAESYTVFRTYYYDCPPYQSKAPTPEESQFLSGKEKFFKALRQLERFEVRLGRLEYRGTDDEGKQVFAQKRVDLQMGLDIASLAGKSRVQMMTLVMGDSDLIPAVEFAKQEGILTRLVHGPRGTYHQDLWERVDERKEITMEFINRILRKK